MCCGLAYQRFGLGGSAFVLVVSHRLHRLFSYQNCFGFSLRLASSAISLMRFCLVSARLASTSHCRIAFFTDLLKLKKKSFEPLWVLNAFSKSAGMVSSSTSSKIVHLPFCFAVSIVSKPAFVLRHLHSRLTMFDLEMPTSLLPF